MLQEVLDSVAWDCSANVINITFLGWQDPVESLQCTFFDILHYQICYCHVDWQPHRGTKGLLVYPASKAQVDCIQTELKQVHQL